MLFKILFFYLTKGKWQLFFFPLSITTIMLARCLFLYYQPRTDKANVTSMALPAFAGTKCLFEGQCRVPSTGLSIHAELKS